MDWSRIERDTECLKIQKKKNKKWDCMDWNLFQRRLNQNEPDSRERENVKHKGKKKILKENEKQLRFQRWLVGSMHAFRLVHCYHASPFLEEIRISAKWQFSTKPG